MNAVLDLLMGHRSIRKYKKQSVEEEKVKAIIEAAQWSATSGHFQAYTIIRVNDSQKRQAISELAGGQKWVVECPLFLMFCGDLNRSKKNWQGIDPKVLSNTEFFTMATIDAALAAQNAYTAAASLGLGGVYVGGIRNDIKAVSEVLSLPEYVYPLFGICLGYPAENPGLKPRLPMDVIYKVDDYNDSEDSTLIAAYDNEILDYYKKRSDGKIQDTWTTRSGGALMAKTREEVGPALREKGFCLK